MRLWLTTIVAIALISFGNAANAADPTVLVVVKKSNSVEAYNGKTFERIGAVEVGDSPHEIVANPGGKYAYVSNFDGLDNTVTVFDIDKLQVVKRLDMKPLYRPHGLGLSSDGSKLYVTCEGSRKVAEVDVKTWKTTQAFGMQMRGTHMLALAPDDKLLCATNGGSNNVSIVDIVSGRVGFVIAGLGCEGISISPDGKKVWTADRRGETVTVINLETRKREATLPCKGYPMRAAFSKDGSKVFVTTATTGHVVVFDADKQEVITTIKTGAFPLGIHVADNGEHVFVANRTANTVSVIDAESLEVIGDLRTGEQPDGITWVR